MVGWPDVAGRHYPGRGTAHRVDHVDCARGGGDNPTIVVVDARSADMSVDLDTGTSLDDHAVNSRSAVRRELPIRSGRLGEPVDMFHRDHHIVAPHSFHGEAHRGDASALDIHHRALDGWRSDPLLVALANLIEGDSDIFGQTADRAAPHRLEDPGLK